MFAGLLSLFVQVFVVLSIVFVFGLLLRLLSKWTKCFSLFVSVFPEFKGPCYCLGAHVFV